ncbi:hypothetical protein U1Q18_001542 [Sarracenia purpurea var. burkii]
MVRRWWWTGRRWSTVIEWPMIVCVGGVADGGSDLELKVDFNGVVADGGQQRWRGVADGGSDLELKVDFNGVVADDGQQGWRSG